MIAIFRIVKESMAAMASRWLRRKTSQRLAGSGSAAFYEQTIVRLPAKTGHLS